MRCLGLIVLAIIGQAYGQDLDLDEFCTDVCKEFPSGGHFAYPGNCCKYIQCKELGYEFKGYNETCMYPLVWNDRQSSCDFAFRVPGCDESCHVDGVEWAPPAAGAFDPATECVRYGKIYTVHPDNEQWYYVDQFGIDPNNSRHASCPPNFVFDLDECLCVGLNDPWPCNCIMCVPFELNMVRDIVNRNHVNHRGVRISSYAAQDVADDPGHFGCFSGDDSFLEIPVFSDMYYGPAFSGNFFYYPTIPGVAQDDPINIPGKMGLFTNGCCNESASIEIWLEGSNAYITFRTEGGSLVNHIFQDGDTLQDEIIYNRQFGEITFVYGAPNLTLCINGKKCVSINTTLTPLGGDVLSTDCALKIGQLNDEEGTSFNGCVDNISVCADVWDDEQIYEVRRYNETAVMCHSQDDDFGAAGADSLPPLPGLPPLPPPP